MLTQTPLVKWRGSGYSGHKKGRSIVSIIGWLIIGAVAGWLASMVTGRNEEMNWLENIVVGVVGALVGGFLYGLITDSDWTNSFSIGTLLVAFLGAIVILFVYNAVKGRARG